MSISIQASTSAATALQGQRQPPPPPKLSGTAELLGTTTQDLQQQLASGTKLQDLAAAKGISGDDLKAQIAADLKAGKPADAPELSDAQLTAFAGRIAAGEGPKGPGGPGGPGGPPPSGGPRRAGQTEDTDANLSTLASALGTDEDTLKTMLTSVSDLGALLAKSGVTGYGSDGSGVATRGIAVDRYA